jgi:hypothetical protein
MSDVASIFHKDPEAWTEEDRAQVIARYRQARLDQKALDAKTAEPKERKVRAKTEPKPKRSRAEAKPKPDPRQIDLEEVLAELTAGETPT